MRILLYFIPESGGFRLDVRIRCIVVTLPSLISYKTITLMELFLIFMRVKLVETHSPLSFLAS